MKKEEKISLYIHIPFCKRKCYYCDFPSFQNEEENHDNYVDTLLQELENKSELTKNKIVQSIFFGGGTPTTLSVNLLTSIMKKIYEKFNVSEIAEITIEANPATFDEEKALKLREMGFNRISMGVQAWQNSLLKSLGRLHNIEDFIENFNAVRKAGFQNVNVDLMFSLPNQTFDMWKETLEKIVELSPEHISVYSLIIEEDTVFYEYMEKGIIEEIDEDLDREMYHFAINYLKENNYNQYEISNFSKNSLECKHNIVYWSMEDYIGIGLSAHSYFDGKRFHNPYDLKAYISSKGDFNTLTEDVEIIDEKNEISEYMFLGLRMNKGILFSNFYKKFGKNIDDVYPNVVDELINKKLMLKENNKYNNEDSRIFLTRKGMDLSNIVFEKFLL